MSELVASPLFEFDPSPRGFIEPAEQIRRIGVPSACVVTFFGDAVDRLRRSGRARLLADNTWEDGPHPLLELAAVAALRIPVPHER